jgi:hypothetical protein
MQDFGRRTSTADVKDERIPRVGAHADSRDMVIHADCDLVESYDKDITVQSSPEDNTADWFSMCDNKQVFETHAYYCLGAHCVMVLFENEYTDKVMGRQFTHICFYFWL